MSSVFKNVKTNGTTQLQGTNILGTGATTYTMPSARGTNNQILSTNGTGVVDWIEPSASELYTSGSSVVINSTAPVNTGYALITTSPTVATWQNIDTIANSYNYVSVVSTTNPTAYSALITDSVIASDSTLGALNITIPLISTFAGGAKKYIIVDEAGVANNGNKKITVFSSGTDTINNAPSASISTGNGSLTIVSNKVNNWLIY